MLLADYIMLGVIAVVVILGLVVGFSGGLKFFTSGIFGIVISVVVTYFLLGIVNSWQFVQDLLSKLNGMMGDLNHLSSHSLHHRADSTHNNRKAYRGPVRDRQRLLQGHQQDTRHSRNCGSRRNFGSARLPDHLLGGRRHRPRRGSGSRGQRVQTRLAVRKQPSPHPCRLLYKLISFNLRARAGLTCARPFLLFQLKKQLFKPAA